MNMKNWDGKVPDWELEPIGTEKKESQEPSVEEAPSFAELRVAEIAKEAKVVTPEDPEKKAAQIEARLAEIRAFDHPEAKSLFAQKSENLGKRTNGEISGIELDRLDKEIDEKIKNLGTETIAESRWQNLNRNKENGNVKKEDHHSPSFENTDNLTEEIKNEHTIRRVYDFDSLMKAIDKVGDITGSDGHVYKPDYLKDIIGEVFMGRKQLNYVTGTFGLRDKVESLLEARQAEMDRRVADEREKKLKSPEQKIKDEIYELENLRQLREMRDRAPKVENKEKKSRSIFNR